MSRDAAVSRLVAAAERLHGTAEGVRAWARGQPPGELPAPLQRILDAADEYATSLGELYVADDEDTNENEQPIARKGASI